MPIVFLNPLMISILWVIIANCCFTSFCYPHFCWIWSWIILCNM